ncbi:MAG: aminotransferase class V-fold PLP-dependent enzyme [Leptospirales bacterium]|nr:aminotransferase class V-fold PLP-dependent enzyme [Leptospirales bacterium]
MSIFLNHCGVSRMLPAAAEAASTQIRLQAEKGSLMFQDWVEPLNHFKTQGATLLGTTPDNVSYVRNTSEGLSLLASGYPLQPGDEILSYVHEYPANHYPWKIQEGRGARLVLIQNRSHGELCGGSLAGPGGFRFEDIESKVTDRTRIVALSHVQFTSGFAFELKRVGDFCKARNIDLIVDCAQSLGALEIIPEQMNIAALAASGWKWLMGPVGTGLMYTAPGFRERIKIVFAGADLMVQGMDYLNHTWNPHTDARKFEYSTHDFVGTAALAASMKSANEFGIKRIQEVGRKLRDLFLSRLDQSKYSPLIFAAENQSGIISLVPGGALQADEVGRKLAAQGIVVAPRAGFVRIAPHYTNSEADIVVASDALNAI